MSFPSPSVVSLTPATQAMWRRVKELTALEILLHVGEILVILGVWGSLSARYTYIGYGIVAYLGVTALAGIVKLTPFMQPLLLGWIQDRQNPFRWAEYFFSSSIMVVVIAWLVGLTSPWVLVGLFALNALMITTGYLIETQRDRQILWYALGVGCFTVIWITLGLACRDYMETNGASVGIPFIFAFWLFCTFGINMWLAIQKIGWYQNYYWVEMSYLLLSILSKSGLVWAIWYVLYTT